MLDRGVVEEGGLCGHPQFVQVAYHMYASVRSFFRRNGSALNIGSEVACANSQLTLVLPRPQLSPISTSS